VHKLALHHKYNFEILIQKIDILKKPIQSSPASPLPPSSQSFSIGLHPNDQINMIPNTNASKQELPNFYQERPVKMITPEKLTLPMDICYTYDFMNRQIVLQNGGICNTLPVRNFWIDTDPPPFLRTLLKTIADAIFRIIFTIFKFCLHFVHYPTCRKPLAQLYIQFYFF
jgi:hypothetical protein